MVKKSSTSKGKQPAATLPVEEPSTVEEDDDRWLPLVEVVKTNPYSLSELKTSLDDTVKEFFSLPRNNFQTSYKHQDIKLLLGWTSVFIALGTSYYSYKKQDFNLTKPLVTLGVGLYLILNTILVLYVQFFEQPKDLIWLGKRRTIASRISTEVLSISSTAFSTPFSNSTQSSWIPFPLSLLSSTSPPPPPPTHSSSSSSNTTSDKQQENKYPLYSLTLNYTHLANANKSLLNRKELVFLKPFEELFDEEGKISRDKVEKWLKDGFEQVMMNQSKDS
ncbi:hypothetical protein JCM3765_002790 [Sporobolomyces pararoseus]